MGLFIKGICRDDQGVGVVWIPVEEEAGIVNFLAGDAGELLPLTILPVPAVFQAPAVLLGDAKNHQVKPGGPLDRLGVDVGLRSDEAGLEFKPFHFLFGVVGVGLGQGA